MIDYSSNNTENLLNKIDSGKGSSNIGVTQCFNVFENTEEDRKPAYILFGLQPELFIILTKAQYMKANYGVELILVPHGGLVPTEGETQVSTQFLVDFIDANTVTIYSDDNGFVDDNTGEAE